jgi:adenosylmethionine-8-amino-7-oxononanoate aminotransferase
MLHDARKHRGNNHRLRDAFATKRVKPHLRIEARAFPAGPTVVDEMANGAFFFGLMAAVELVEDRASKASFDASRKIGPAVIAEARRRGLVTRGRGDTIYLGPALVMQPAMIKRVVEIVAESVHAVLGAG